MDNETLNTGVNETPVAEVSTETNDIVQPETEQVQQPESTEQAQDKIVQTPEQNKAFAEMRRKAEAAEKKAKAADEWVEKYYGNQGIHNWEQYQDALTQEEARAAKEQEEKQLQNMRDAGIDPDLINQFIENHPAIKQAKAVVEKEKFESNKQQIDKQIKELTDEFPDSGIKDIQTLTTHPQYDKIAELFSKGYELIDAYEKINRSEIRKKSAEAAKQAALNNVNSTNHIKPVDGNTNIDISSVPKETYSMYKQWFPTWTDEQILKHYKNS